jgi:pimeloyl-ACP methyl ester carboxylesterase
VAATCCRRICCLSTTIIEVASSDRVAPTRVMMLSAAFTEPSDFVRNGFARAVSERSLDVDLVFAGFRLEDLIDGNVFERLRDEIIAPAQALGCRLWLGGISLGAYIALGCARRHGQELAGLCLFAPYLGSHLITAEIERAQGVEGWRAAEPDHDDEDRRIWEFIRTLRTRPLAIHLGLGREDRFGRRQRLLAAALPPSSVDIVPGGHDWPTWRALWDRFLDARLASKGALAGSVT